MFPLLWTPIDIPQFTQEQKDVLIKNYTKDYTSDTAKAMESQSFTERLYDCRYSESKFKDEYCKTHQFLFDFILEHLPFDKLINVKIHRQYRDSTKSHIDFVNPTDELDLFKNNSANEPCGYRMVISGSRQGPLHIENSKGEKVFPELPSTTDWYAIGSTNVLHSVKVLDPGRMIIFAHGWINEDKHADIIDRSLNKYSKYAIWDS
jgi:hypothetical protein